MRLCRSRRSSSENPNRFWNPNRVRHDDHLPSQRDRHVKTPGHNCAVGRIRYSVVDGDDAPDGVIVYIKPACYGDEPRDIYEYFKINPTFPHESTSDQFFSESQFESYRMLGAYTMEKLCTDCDGDFRCFIRRHFKAPPPDRTARLAGRIARSTGKQKQGPVSA